MNHLIAIACLIAAILQPVRTAYAQPGASTDVTLTMPPRIERTLDALPRTGGSFNPHLVCVGCALIVGGTAILLIRKRRSL